MEGERNGLHKTALPVDRLRWVQKDGEREVREKEAHYCPLGTARIQK